MEAGLVPGKPDGKMPTYTYVDGKSEQAEMPDVTRKAGEPDDDGEAHVGGDHVKGHAVVLPDRKTHREQRVDAGLRHWSCVSAAL